MSKLQPSKHLPAPWPRSLRLLGMVCALALSLAGCEQSSQLARIQAQGELLVATRTAGTTYYQGPRGPAGLDYALVSRFAEHLGVRLRLVFPEDLSALLEATRRGRVHMAAAGLTDTPQRRRALRFSLPYQEINEELVYRRGSHRPSSLDQIAPGQLHVVAGSSHAETLARLQQHHPQLHWVERRGVGHEELMQEVNRGEISFGISDSHELALAQRVHRYLRTAFPVGESRQLAWAFPPSGDDSLRRAANRFLQSIRQDGTLERLIERYYGHTDRLNFVDRRDFRRHLRDRLPRLRKFFQEAAKASGYDWRLLAAIGYQESHWRPDAVSPTGVRGVMMLTRATAERVGVKNRTDARQSIHGGARYLQIVEKKIPERIARPDRLWFTLAGYNVGFGHLEDARILTQRQGGNPDLWMDVKKRLPLLAEREYHETLKHGFARGQEPLTYVENIRNYYDLLVWYDHNPPAFQAE